MSNYAKNTKPFSKSKAYSSRASATSSRVGTKPSGNSSRTVSNYPSSKQKIAKSRVGKRSNRGVFVILNKMSKTQKNLIITILYGLLAALCGFLSIVAIKQTTLLFNLVLAAVLLSGVILGLICTFAPATLSVAGPLYFVCTGIIIAMLCKYVGQYYRGVVLIAIVTTVCVFFAIVISYGLNVLKISNRAHAAMYVFLFIVLHFGFIMCINILLAPELLRSFFVDAGISKGAMGIYMSLCCAAMVLSCFVLWLDYINPRTVITNLKINSKKRSTARGT